mmetsp:Transcript_16393/g.40323  ORF Transcript_16393/g.40323 Transcript_16393/m.40323 type:complete len:230 (+) Transcript_16393:126-815(+)
MDAKSWGGGRGMRCTCARQLAAAATNAACSGSRVTKLASDRRYPARLSRGGRRAATASASRAVSASVTASVAGAASGTVAAVSRAEAAAARISVASVVVSPPPLPPLASPPAWFVAASRRGCTSSPCSLLTGGVPASVPTRVPTSGRCSSSSCCCRRSCSCSCSCSAARPSRASTWNSESRRPRRPYAAARRFAAATTKERCAGSAAEKVRATGTRLVPLQNTSPAAVR